MRLYRAAETIRGGLGIKCPDCGGELKSWGDCESGVSHWQCYKCKTEIDKIAEQWQERAEKAEAELARIMAIIEKNPYPETVFRKITDEEFIKIHEILQREMNMPIDRLSGEYMRMLRKQIMREIKEGL